jgi:hypothetical protein
VRGSVAERALSSTSSRVIESVRLASSLESDTAGSSSIAFAAGVAIGVIKDPRPATHCAASKTERRTEGLWSKC